MQDSNILGKLTITDTDIVLDVSIQHGRVMIYGNTTTQEALQELIQKLSDAKVPFAVSSDGTEISALSIRHLTVCLG
jgi:hypothetical protein